MLLPAQVVDDPVITGTGSGVIGTLFVALPLHAPFPSVIPRTTLPDAPAVKVRFGVPWPLVIVPPEIVQVYVAPGCDATEAFALAFAQTFAGAVMVTACSCEIGIVAVEVAVQPPEVTTMPSPTLPEAPAMKVMFGVP